MDEEMKALTFRGT